MLFLLFNFEVNFYYLRREWIIYILSFAYLSCFHSFSFSFSFSIRVLLFSKIITYDYFIKTFCYDSDFHATEHSDRRIDALGFFDYLIFKQFHLMRIHEKKVNKMLLFLKNDEHFKRLERVTCRFLPHCGLEFTMWAE